MKTQNIWVPVILHFLNNNLSAILSGGSMDAFQNQSVAWGELLPVILINGIVFGGFLFTKPFRLQKP
jgi:membrane protease YdiL (CAAX protease family)